MHLGYVGVCFRSGSSNYVILFAFRCILKAIINITLLKRATSVSKLQFLVQVSEEWWEASCSNLF